MAEFDSCSGSADTATGAISTTGRLVEALVIGDLATTSHSRRFELSGSVGIRSRPFTDYLRTFGEVQQPRGDASKQSRCLVVVSSKGIESANRLVSSAAPTHEEG